VQKNRFGNKFFISSPFENPFDSSDSAIDGFSLGLAMFEPL